MVHVPQMFLSEWREFPSAPCLAGKRNLMTAHVSMLLKSRPSPEMLPFSLCNKKRLAIQHMNRPLFPTTLDSVRHREVGRAKDLSAPPRRSHVAFGNCVVLRATCCLSVERWRRRGRDTQYICYYRVEREGGAVPSRSYGIDGR